MDYLKDYNKYYNFYFQQYITLFIDILKKNKSEGHSIINPWNQAGQVLEQNWKEDKGSGVLESIQIYSKVINADRYYDFDSINKTLKNDIKPIYEGFDTNRKQLFTSYQDFIKSLANQIAFIKFKEIKHSNEKTIHTLYNLNKIEVFSFIENLEYENNVKGFKSEYYKLYPQEREKTMNASPSQTSNTNTNKEKSLTTRERIQNEFSTQERAVLLYLLKHILQPKFIDLTEIVKLTLLIGATDNFKIFEEKKASNAYLYKEAQKNYDVFKKNEIVDKILNLKIKLEDNGLKVIAEELYRDFKKNSLNK